MAEILMMIALWCTSPGYGRSDAAEVQACRDRMLACVDVEKYEMGWKRTWKCAKEERLK